MSGSEITFVAAAFLILGGITAFAQFRWLRPGRVQTVSVFLAGAGTVAALWAAGLPPQWFAGTKAGFGLVVSLGAGAFVARARGGDARAFGFPLLSGMSLTLLVANVLTFARRVL
jgi:hypothetical protein